MLTVQLDTEGWARWPEVVKYALVRGLTNEEAIIELVNSGLSHEEESYV